MSAGNSDGLKACPNPWCHSHERALPLTSIGIGETNITYGRIGYRARCSDCGLRGPTVEKKADAYAAWNTRTEQPADPQEHEAVRLPCYVDLPYYWRVQFEGALGNTSTFGVHERVRGPIAEIVWNVACKYFAALTGPRVSDERVEGWKLVPVEPTEAMLTAGTSYNAAIMHKYDDDGWAVVTDAIWSAMLAASPRKDDAVEVTQGTGEAV